MKLSDEKHLPIIQKFLEGARFNYFSSDCLQNDSKPSICLFRREDIFSRVHYNLRGVGTIPRNSKMHQAIEDKRLELFLK